MSCPYEGKCSEENIKCLTCVHGEVRWSHYVEYHPADKWPDGDGMVTGYWDDKCEFLPHEQPYPSPTSTEWPYLPFDDLRFQTGDEFHFKWPDPPGSIKANDTGDDLRFTVTDYEGATHGSTATVCKDVVLEEL